MLEKTVTLYLLDRDENGNGDAKGRIECTVGNWEGVIYKIPRTKKELCKKDGIICERRLQQCGLYFLFGETRTEGKTVYVCQSGDKNSGKSVWDRVLEHDDIEWTEAIIFVHSSEKSFLDGAGLNYLENKFYWLLKNAEKTGRYKVINDSVREQSASSDITEVQKSVLDNFAEGAKRLMIILEYNILSEALSPNKTDDASKKTRVILFLEANGCKAKGKQTDNGFMVCAGSEIYMEKRNSSRRNILKMREDYADKIDKNGVLTSDLDVFKSPSMAASFVCGTPQNGNNVWHDEKGRTLGELLGKKV